VALLNIIMNGEGIELGPDLQEIKNHTSSLSPPLRGHIISTNQFIRNIHNSFTRRIDLLNADLLLENEILDSKKKNKGGKGRFSKSKKGVPDDDAGYHFIAFVSVAGHVWELDGLETKPLCLGPHKQGCDWTSVAGPIIESRMQQYENEQLSFSLLSICRSPLARIRTALTDGTPGLRALELNLQRSSLALPRDDNAGELARDGLEQDGIPDRVRSIISQNFAPDFDGGVARELYNKLEGEGPEEEAACLSELASLAEDKQKVIGRKKDYTPAIHLWLKILAKHGVLQRLIQNY